MITVKLVSGKIFFDNFDSTSLKDEWNVVPNDSSRYNLTELDGTLKLLHGSQDVQILIDEAPDSYVIDISNSYVPQASGDMGGIVVVKGKDENLEVLEFYDEEKSEQFVYRYIRLVRVGNIYSAYGRNQDLWAWEYIGSVTLSNENGLVGLILKGDNYSGYVDFSCQFFKMYKSQKLQILNIKPGYSVCMYKEDGTRLSYKKCQDMNNGVSLDLLEIPPYNVYFEIFNETKNLVHRSAVFEACGGDVYYYGYVLRVSINGVEIDSSENYFLGYFENSVIEKEVTLSNDCDLDFVNVKLHAESYENSDGYQMVTFSKDGENFFNNLSLGNIVKHSEVKLKMRIVRDTQYSATSVEPFKFYLKLTND